MLTCTLLNNGGIIIIMMLVQMYVVFKDKKHI